jgi:hypothetical protein
MLSETVSNALPLVADTEVSFGILDAPHALTEIIVNAHGDKGAIDSEWRLYDTTAAGEALIWTGVLGIAPIDGAHRLTPASGIGAGARVELRAFSRTSSGVIDASLVGYDPECCGAGDPPNPNLDQPTWYFDAINGKDNQKGNTPAKALKTWGEWLKRIACQACDIDSDPLSILSPTGGLLTLNILTDLPDADPVLFRAIMAAGCTAIINGKEKNITAPIVLAAVGARDRSANQPYTVAAVVPGGWASHLRRYVEITTGAAAGALGIIVSDLGGNTAKINAWADPNIGTDGFVAPSGAVPAPGDSFRIIDYTEVTIGSHIVGYEATKSVGGPPGGLCVQHVRMRQTDQEKAMPTAFGYTGTVTAWAHSIVDGPFSSSPTSCNGTLGNCSLSGTGTLNGGKLVALMGACQNTDSGNYPGAFDLKEGCYFSAYDPMLQGDSANFVFSDIRVGNGAWTEISILSTWDSDHGLLVIAGGMAWLGRDFFFGEFEQPTMWGDGNVADIYLEAGSTVVQNLQSFAKPVVLPSWIGGNGPGNAVFSLSPGERGSPEYEKGWAFDRAAAAFKPAGGASTTWANFLVPVTAGGFQETATVEVFSSGTDRVLSAVACHPSADAKAVLSGEVFIPTPGLDAGDAVLAAGVLTLTGAAGRGGFFESIVPMAGFTTYTSSVVLTGTGAVTVTQAAILGAGGTFTDNLIVIPAVLIPGVAIGTTFAQVKATNMLSTVTPFYDTSTPVALS